MEAAREAYVREQLALERIDLEALRRRASELVRPGLQDLVFPFTLSRLRPQHTVHIRDVVAGFVPSSEPLRQPVIDLKHLVFASPKAEVPVVPTQRLEPPPPPPAGKKKRSRTSGDAPEAPRRRKSVKESVPESSSAWAYRETVETPLPKASSREEGSNAKNMYEVIWQVFEEFWLMEFSDPGITAGTKYTPPNIIL